MIERAAEFLDSFHGVVAGRTGRRQDVGCASNASAAANELDVWRLRCLVLVSWSTGLSGALLAPIYAVDAGVSSKCMGGILLSGSCILLSTPTLFQKQMLTREACSWLVALTSLLVMTVLTIGSGGFPLGLAPGIQRILPILVLCFGSLRLGLFVTMYVIIESILHQAFFAGAIQPVMDSTILELVIGGSWVFQPVILLILGASLHVAGSQTIAALENLSNSKARFLSVVSHELRTPLHGILGSCELALSSSNNNNSNSTTTGGTDNGSRLSLDDCTDTIETVQVVASHLSGIVEDLLLYSSSSNIRIQCQRFGIRNMFRTVEAALSGSVANYGCTLHFDIVPQHDVVYPEDSKVNDFWFMGDELRLRQCIINVANNALKYGSATKCAVTVRLESIQMVRGEDNNKGKDETLFEVIIVVHDTGPGICKKDLDRIFLPFEQGGTDLSRFAGVGLGLSLVSDLLAKMNGRITCVSTIGEGSSFYLTVRLGLAEPPPLPEHDHVAVRNGAQTATVNNNEPSCTKSAPSQPSAIGSCGKPDPQHSKADPIAILTAAALDTSFTKSWNGEVGMFEIISPPQNNAPGSNIWEGLVDALLTDNTTAGTLITTDVVAFDDSDEAKGAAVRLRTLINTYRVLPVPLIRICDTSIGTSIDNGDDKGPFDAVIHPLVLPALARNWYRSLVLGAWVLVVDDVALNRKILHKHLSKLGHHVTEAVNGREACKAAAAAGFAMDMIAMDLMMPVMNGRDAALEIRETEYEVRGKSCRPCPIFAVTAGDESLLRGNDHAVFSGLLGKPLTAKKLRGTVRHQVIRRMLPIG